MRPKTDNHQEQPLEVTADGLPHRSRRPTSAEPMVREAQLVALRGKAKGRRFRISDTAHIGREPSCEVWLHDDQISRQHARINREGGAYWLEDLKSKNGVKVNGVKVSRVQLTFGDRVAFGSSAVLLFTHDDPLEEQLAQAQRLEAAGVLAAGVAHEFNNLLGAVIGNLSLLDEELVDAAEAKICVKEALQAAVRGADLAGQMLDFSRARHRESESVDAGELIASVERFARQALGPNIELSIELPTNTPDLHFEGDRMQIYQAMINLCLNARDAVDDHGSIHIRASLVAASGDDDGDVDEYVQIEVADNGRGMSEEVKARAFDPFFTTKTVGEGTGLGLSVVHGIAHSHGGKVSLESEEGAGTKVRVLLPHALRPTIMPRPRAGVESKLSGRVLVVDDNELLLNATERYLRTTGLDVVIATNGHEALRVVEEEHAQIDLVILDMLMPAMDGTETFKEIRRRVPEMPVLLVSGYGGRSDAVKKLLQAGAAGFVAKPIVPSELERVIARCLQRQG